MKKLLTLIDTKECSPVLVNLLASLFLSAFYNAYFWHEFLDINAPTTWHNSLYSISMYCLMVMVTNLLLLFFTNKYSHKAVLAILFLSASICSYYVDNFHIRLDQAMWENVLQTDLKEAIDVWHTGFFVSFFFWGILPSLLIMKLNIARGSDIWGIMKAVSVTVLISILVLVVSAKGFYQDYASTFRNHHSLKNLIIPNAYVNAISKYYLGKIKSPKPAAVKTYKASLDAGVWATVKKPVLNILVVGETARKKSFSLGGYERKTNPRLEKENVIFFDHFYSCGTATAKSLPCMFSPLSRDKFSALQSQESLASIVSSAGFDVQWRDNNSGCKGACDNVKTIDFSHIDGCEYGHCMDEVMLTGLQQILDNDVKNRFIVMHQQGSHGPAYYKRYPSDAEIFSPACKETNMRKCSNQELVNAYDNSIAYTDDFLSQVIQLLKNNEETYATSFIYVSDHGESVGENGYYLHGLPYYMAPDEQKHIPFILWLSESFKNDFPIDSDCLKSIRSNAFSHDNLYHSVLGLLGISVSNYLPNLDFIRQCRPLSVAISDN